MSLDTTPPVDGPSPSDPGAKVRGFPTGPGLYLMKDAAGTVVYIGKAKNLRSRACSYFAKDAVHDSRIRDWIGLVQDVDFIETADPIAAMFAEARMIKDIRPRFNKDLKDDKTFPYLQIRTREEFPRSRDHAQAAAQGRAALWPLQQRPATPPGDERPAATHAVPHLQARHLIERREVAHGSGRACCTRSAAAPRRATSASRARTTGGRSRSSSSFSKGRRTGSFDG